MFRVHKTIQCGDQIIEFLLSAHDTPLLKFFARLVSIATNGITCASLYRLQ